MDVGADAGGGQQGEVQQLLVRCVHPATGEGVFLRVPVNAAFQDYTAYMSQQLGAAVGWFEYEDDDRDRITVSSDQDVANMIQMYSWMYTQNPSPLVVHPKLAGAAPDERNVLGLTIDVGPGAPNGHQEAAAAEVQAAAPIAALDSPLQIQDSDLQPIEALGSGNGGTVYKTLHVPSDSVIAVKIIPVDLSEDVQRKILMELEILHKCRSEHIIQYFGAYFSENRIKICTEYMDGGSLDQFGQIPETVLGPIVVSVLRGLHYLWSLKVMHRDVKPSNILVNSLGQVKLCDFGVGTQLQQSVTKTFVGTNAYMAPERILAQPYTVRSEIWSLAVSLVEMAIGRFPYPTSDSPQVSRTLLPIELLQCIVNEEPPRLGGGFSVEFQDFVARSLVKDASQRPTPGDMLDHAFVRGHAERGGVVREWIRAMLVAQEAQRHKMREAQLREEQQQRQQQQQLAAGQTWQPVYHEEPRRPY